MTDASARRPDRTWLIIGLVFVAFWVVYLTFFVPGRGPNLAEMAMDRPAEYRWPMEDLQGQAVSLERYRGKTVFLNVWATWCPPCVREMPSIADLARREMLKGKNIEFVCVSLDRDRDKVSDFIRGKNWPMTFLHATDVPMAYETEGIPATFILSPAGRIVSAEVGASDWDRPDIVEFLQKTAETPPAPDPSRDPVAPAKS
ncbi:Thiol-disulfide oxidoreductase ResA [Aquisphaera giovannonii]|uniref:Thiol-disulfide oxidoreductase ResA n=1 Tax=Aquisphaera giovannonii TaxID=406548 RepID=A0A5B9W0X2_9BACT|nr:TlpA disulfide reductase family protein [Aquisphaera giovannonii]QEH33891.1 Thiol-disulfide oxidoreductase ResA [Aquisphaera giovannonii]